MNIYYSQWEQDKILDELFDKKHFGVFVDVGAHDGLSCSNSAFFERSRHWTGLCVEAMPNLFRKLATVRRCACENVAATNYDGTAQFRSVTGYSEMLSGLEDNYNPRHRQRLREEIEQHGGEATSITVKTNRLQTLFDRYGMRKIDFLSIDVEGAEQQVLEGVDWDAMDITYVLYEENYREEGEVTRKFMEEKGYVLVQKIVNDLLYKKS